MGLGLVSKARKEKQLRDLKKNRAIREENRARWANIKPEYIKMARKRINKIPEKLSKFVS